MQQYKSNHQLCKELCPTLTVSESYVREYRSIANDAIDMLLELHWQDWQGHIVEVDVNRVTVLLDRLLSAQASEK